MKLNEVTNQFLTDIDDIKKWLNLCGLTDYNINPDTLIVDVHQPATITWKNITYRLPVQFGTAHNNFTIAPGSNIRSLHGCPHIVNGNFICANNKMLTIAEGGPVIVNGFAVYSSCPILTFIGLPKEVHGDLYISDTNIKSVSGIHKQIKLIDGKLYMGMNGSNIKTGLISLLLIRKLQSVEIAWNIHSPNSGIRIDEAMRIINKHLAGNRSGPDCQIELQDAGLAQYAKL